MGAGVVNKVNKKLLQFYHDHKHRDNGYEQYEVVHIASFAEPIVRHHRIPAMQRLLTLSGAPGLSLLMFLRLPSS